MYVAGFLLCTSFFRNSLLFSEYYETNETINFSWRYLRDNCLADEDEITSSKLITPYALDFILKAKERANNKNYRVLANDGVNFPVKSGLSIYNCTIDTCTCNFMKKIKLPCHHVFFIRKYLSMPLFYDGFIHHRWTMSYYKSCVSARFTKESDQVNTYQGTHTISLDLVTRLCSHKGKN